MNDKHLPDDERDAYRAFLDEMTAHYSIHQPTGREMAVVLRSRLERSGERWAEQVLDDAQIDGLWNAFKSALKAEAVTLISHDGKLVGKSVRVGAKRRRDDGSEAWQQSLLHDMSWSQVEQWLDTTVRQISSLLVNQDVAERLLVLHERVPDSFGPAEACGAIGTTLDEFLGQAA